MLLRTCLLYAMLFLCMTVYLFFILDSSLLLIYEKKVSFQTTIFDCWLAAQLISQIKLKFFGGSQLEIDPSWFNSGVAVWRSFDWHICMRTSTLQSIWNQFSRLIINEYECISVGIDSKQIFLAWNWKFFNLVLNEDWENELDKLIPYSLVCVIKVDTMGPYSC